MRWEALALPVADTFDRVLRSHSPGVEEEPPPALAQNRTQLPKPRSRSQTESASEVLGILASP